MGAVPKQLPLQKLFHSIFCHRHYHHSPATSQSDYSIDQIGDHHQLQKCLSLLIFHLLSRAYSPRRKLTERVLWRNPLSAIRSWIASEEPHWYGKTDWNADEVTPISPYWYFTATLCKAASWPHWCQLPCDNPIKTWKYGAMQQCKGPHWKMYGWGSWEGWTNHSR